MNRPLIAPALAEALRNARHVAVLTGAGVSAESGLPTFREAQTGLWAKFRPEELATRQAFKRNPQLVWDWYSMRRQLCLAAEPNPAHRALARLAQLVPTLSLITQNVDRLHQRAGSMHVIELHGNLSQLRCFAADHRCAWIEAAAPPPCAICGSPLRPDVVWFGESLPMPELQAAIRAAETCDLFLVVGTSGQVYPAATLPDLAANNGATIWYNLFEVVRNDTGPRFALPEPAGIALPALLSAAFGE